MARTLTSSATRSAPVCNCLRAVLQFAVMSLALRQRLFTELDSLVLIDPHTHINPHAPASQTLADVLGYHYYTELAHSAGLHREAIEEPGIEPKEKVRRLVEAL